TRSRVRNVDDMPERFLSRNSTRLKCEPTVTISRAPFSAAIRSATSSLVAGARPPLYSSPSSSRRSRPGARPPGDPGPPSRRPVAEVGLEVGQIEVPGQQLALLADVGDRVLGERLQRVADLPPPGLVLACDLLRVEQGALRDHGAVPDQRRAAKRERGAFLEP